MSCFTSLGTLTSKAVFQRRLLRTGTLEHQKSAWYWLLSLVRRRRATSAPKTRFFLGELQEIESYPRSFTEDIYMYPPIWWITSVDTIALLRPLAALKYSPKARFECRRILRSSRCQCERTTNKATTTTSKMKGNSRGKYRRTGTGPLVNKIYLTGYKKKQKTFRSFCAIPCVTLLQNGRRRVLRTRDAVESSLYGPRTTIGTTFSSGQRASRVLSVFS